MNSTRNVIYIDRSSGIPILGIDFFGIIDRGTNIIELKPITFCNLKCKYCFVSSGDYNTNFIINSEYLVEKVNHIAQIKGSDGLEIHIAPYGETLLYKELFSLIGALWKIQGVKIISIQSNGLLLSSEIIKKLEEVNLTRINISLNTLNQDLANNLCNTKEYNMKRLIKSIDILLNSNINVLIAPVWFPGENDEDIEEIIQFVIKYRHKGLSQEKIHIGIQKYLMYKTGRKLKKIRPKTWDYFYKQLTHLEKKYNIKLKLGPNDFGIQKRKNINDTRLAKGDLIKVKVISKGRWKHECIGKVNENLGIKIILKKSVVQSDQLIDKEIIVKIIKANYRDNIITAIFPPSN